MKNRPSARPARRRKPSDARVSRQETGPARRLHPHAEKAGARAPSGAAAQVVLSLVRTSRGVLSACTKRSKYSRHGRWRDPSAFGKLVILLTCWKLGNKSAWATSY